MNSEQNLLFAALALQLNFVQRSDLIAAAADWVLDKETPLPSFLIRREVMNDEECSLIEKLVEKHLEKHHGDISQSLASVPVAHEVSSHLADLEKDLEKDIKQTISQISDGSTPKGSDIATIDHSSSKPASDSADDEKTMPHPSGTASETEPPDDPTKTYVDQRLADTRFHLLRLHAEGGLGKVSVARDEELGREVALKEIQEHFADNEQSRTRFVMEAEVTGALEHPGVAPVYALGSDQMNRPFYAMRFVKGDSLKKAISLFHKVQSPDDWAIGSLELRQILQQFITVCQTMHYAHSRGIIHRDIKPSNIMLGPYGETLVVNWGLAKSSLHDYDESINESLVKPSSGSGSKPTVMGAAIGTPPLMSPEQANGRSYELGPKSDVYSLGSTLYCILTGKAPYEEGSSDSIIQRVTKGEFPPPRELNEHIPAALEAICLKAMQKDPKKRYASARAIGDDLEKWLADEPVTVYQENRQEQIGRWIRKNRSATLATGATLAGIAIVSLVAAIFINQARASEANQREIAETQEGLALAAKEEAEGLATKYGKLAETERSLRIVADRSQNTYTNLLKFALGVSDGQQEFSLLDQYPNGAAIRDSFLSFAVTEFESMIEQVSEDSRLEFKRAKLLIDLGDMLRHTAAAEGELPPAIQYYQTAFDLLDKIEKDSGEDHTPIKTRIIMKQANTLAVHGDSQNAVEEYEAALETLKKARARNDNIELQRVMAEIQLNLGAVVSGELEYDKAGEMLLQARANYKEVLKVDPRDDRAKRNLITLTGNLGIVDAAKGRHAEALAKFRKAMEMHDELVSSIDPKLMLFERGALANDFANVLKAIGRSTDATNYYRSAIDDFSELFELAPGLPNLMFAHALTQYNFGQLLRQSYQFEKSSKELTEALDSFTYLEQHFPSYHAYAFQAALVRDELSRQMASSGENAESLITIEDAIRRFMELAQADERYMVNVVLSHGHMAELLYKTDELVKSDEEFKKVISNAQQLADSFNQTSFYRYTLAMQQYRHAWSLIEVDLDRTESLLDQANSNFVLAGSIPDASPEELTRAVWHLLFVPLDDKRMLAEAAEILKKVEVKVNDPVEVLALKGILSYYQNQSQSALTFLESAIKQRPYVEVRDHFYVAMVKKKLKMEDAEEALKKATDLAGHERQGDLIIQRVKAEAQKLFGSK